MAFLLNKNSVNEDSGNFNFVVVAGKRIGFFLFRFMMVNRDSWNQRQASAPPPNNCNALRMTAHPCTEQSCSSPQPRQASGRRSMARRCSWRSSSGVIRSAGMHRLFSVSNLILFICAHYPCIAIWAIFISVA